ncbi:MAG TPA: hypothetical protein PLE19_16140 [Planctomycetota bacterium]|nr:hypothetical protein [Planctomycetota bacterium]HRR80006.1 hypothetical protein [Planctomycetota bacterium]HRT97629.1 hypothetical protein [Planctomycetota bacterium]
MKAFALALCVQVLAVTTHAEHVLREFTWETVMANGAPPGVEVATKAPGKTYNRIRITNPADQPLTVTLLTIEHPPITRATYALIGMVCCEEVKGKGYLELWSHFLGGDALFSRTLADAGPMRHLEGSCDWRPFVLPFYAKEDAPAPERLVLNIVLPARGVVHLGTVRLAQYRHGEDPIAVTAERDAWWSGRAAGLMGGILGGALGGLGGLVGLLAGRGRARGFVLGAVGLLLPFGLLMLALGLVALAVGQPHVVWYPPLLLGILSAAIPLVTRPQLRRRYEELELRRIQAADARP